MTELAQLFENYRIALLSWNDAIRNHKRDHGKIKQTSIKYNEQKLALEKMQDKIISQSGDVRHFKRGYEI